MRKKENKMERNEGKRGGSMREKERREREREKEREKERKRERERERERKRERECVLVSCPSSVGIK